MTIQNLFSKMKVNLFNIYTKDHGKGLIHTGAIGWFFSSLAQVTVVATDKNISKKEKKFLVPQEICDGVTNVTLYYTISQIIKNSGDWLINKGYLLTDDMAQILTKLKPKTTSIEQALKGYAQCTKTENRQCKELLQLAKKPLKLFLDHFDKMPEFLNLPKVEQELLRAKIPTTLENLGNFKNNIGVITSIAASILASNLITPVVRNKLASAYQQKFILKNEPKKQETYKPQPLPKAFDNFNISSSMKI